jgi:hypothetical protein
MVRVQVDQYLDHGKSTGQDRDPPFRQLEKLAHGMVQKNPAVRQALTNPQGAGKKKPAISGPIETLKILRKAGIKEVCTAD